MGEGERRRLAEIVKGLEGQHVNVDLADGSRIDDCQLVSGGRSGSATLWLYTNGADRFVALTDVRDVWQPTVGSPYAA
jgi:hypothetical protein